MKREDWADLSPLLFGIVMATAVAMACLFGGCAYKGGKIVDGTNIAIGLTIPGTEWTINALDYVGGLRVAGNDMTEIKVRNEVDETNSYFGLVETRRKSKLRAEIAPVEDAKKPEDGK